MPLIEKEKDDFLDPNDLLGTIAISKLEAHALLCQCKHTSCCTAFSRISALFFRRFGDFKVVGFNRVKADNNIISAINLYLHGYAIPLTLDFLKLEALLKSIQASEFNSFSTSIPPQFELQYFNKNFRVIDEKIKSTASSTKSTSNLGGFSLTDLDILISTWRNGGISTYLNEHKEFIHDV